MKNQVNNNLEVIEKSEEQGLLIDKKAEDDQELKKRLVKLEAKQKRLISTINDLKCSKQLITSSRDFYKKVFSRVKDVVVIISLDGQIEYISSAVRELAGFDPQEVIGNHIQDYFVKNEEYRYSMKMLGVLLITQKRLQPIELMIKTKYADPVYVEVRGYVVKKDDHPHSIELTLRNINKRKDVEFQQTQQRYETEGKLRESELKYRRLFENTGLATVIADRDKTIAKVNEIFLKGSGYSRQDLEGKKKWTELIPEEELPKTLAIWEKFKNDPDCKRTIFEFKALKKNGHLIHVIGRVVAFPETDQFVGSFLDVTQMKQTEAELINSKKRLFALMSNLPGMAYSCTDTENRKFRFISKGCKAITGFDSQDLIDANDLSYLDLILTNDRQRVKNQLYKAIKDKTSFQIKYRIRTKDDNEKWVLQTGQAIFSETGEFISIEGIIIDATEHVKEEQALVDENKRLKTTLQGSYRFGNIIGKSQAMQNVYKLIVKASNQKNHVIIYGESGTGKELVAQAIHDLSDRRDKVFITVNCGAIPESLIESEFFGYKKGAFTGAIQDKKGYFAEADGGTIFLDEIGEISINMQVKLLRVIEGGGYTPVGMSQTAFSDVRIIAATNKNLWELIRHGKIREDFYYRIHILPIHLPPLRERLEDLPLLMDHFLKSYGEVNFQDIPMQVLDRLKSYNWPGNIRELQNVLFRYISLGTIEFSANSNRQAKLLDKMAPPVSNGEDQYDLRRMVAEFEKKILVSRLKANSWNKSKTAKELGLDRKTLLKKIKSYGLSP